MQMYAYMYACMHLCMYAQVSKDELDLAFINLPNLLIPLDCRQQATIPSSTNLTLDPQHGTCAQQSLSFDPAAEPEPEPSSPENGLDVVWPVWT